MNDVQRGYREHLVLARQASQDAYDKALLSLSGGALGLSMAFLDKIAAEEAVSSQCLLAAWVLWTASLLLVLFSHFFSHQGLSRALFILDSGAEADVTRGMAVRFTKWCNALGGLAFLAGVCFMVAFAYLNIGS